MLILIVLNSIRNYYALLLKIMQKYYRLNIM